VGDGEHDDIKDEKEMDKHRRGSVDAEDDGDGGVMPGQANNNNNQEQKKNSKNRKTAQIVAPEDLKKDEA